MSYLPGILLNRAKSFLHLAYRVWRDRRVPLLARIFVVVAPFYWINPFDLIPDMQPNGHVDDVTIAFLLFAMALRLVPEAVFKDARKAVNPTVCGVMCLSVLGLASSGAGPHTSDKAVVVNELSLKTTSEGNDASANVFQSLSPNYADPGAAALSRRTTSILTTAGLHRLPDRQQHHPVAAIGGLICLSDRCPNLLVTVSGLKFHDSSKSPQKRCQAPHLHVQSRCRLNQPLNSYSCDNFMNAQDFSSPQNPNLARCDATAIRISLPIRLATRGGQRQLYSSEDASVAACLPRSYLVRMPPQFAGGFFVVSPLFGED